jgi:hypothetical protein
MQLSVLYKTIHRNEIKSEVKLSKLFQIINKPAFVKTVRKLFFIFWTLKDLRPLPWYQRVNTVQ